MRNPYEDEREKERLRKAAMVSLGVTGAGAAMQSIPHVLREARDNSAVAKSRAYQDFLAKLEPGDLVFNREFGAKDKKGGLGHVYDLLSATKGDTFVHPTVYRGKGMVSEAGGGDVAAKSHARMSAAHYPLESRAYRLTDMSPEERKAAFTYLDKMVGTPYKSMPDVAEHGIKHLLGMTEKTTGNPCSGKNGIVCSELVAEAFPKRFADKLMSPLEMRHAKGSELIARYGKSVGVPLRERLLAKAVYPVMKNAKWGLLAGAGALAASAIGDHFDEQT